MQVKIKKVYNSDNNYNVTLSDMTAGKLFAMQLALSDYAEKSPVGKDVHVAFTQAVVEAVKEVDL